MLLSPCDGSQVGSDPAGAALITGTPRSFAVQLAASNGQGPLTTPAEALAGAKTIATSATVQMKTAFRQSFDSSFGLISNPRLVARITTEPAGDVKRKAALQRCSPRISRR